MPTNEVASAKKLMVSPLKRYQKTHCQNCSSNCNPSEQRFLACLLSSLVDAAEQEQPEGEYQASTEVKAESVQALFPRDLVGLLNFEPTPEGWKLKPRQYLGSEAFTKIAAIVKEHGGEYVSEGKTSHFRLPKTSLE